MDHGRMKSVLTLAIDWYVIIYNHDCWKKNFDDFYFSFYIPDKNSWAGTIF